MEQTKFVPSVKRTITLPLFKWPNNKECYYRFDGAIFIGKDIKGDVKDGGKKKDPAHLAFVTNLETGEKGQIIVATVLRGILSEEYENDSYVGKCFGLTQYKISGKDYNGYNVVEIEDPEQPKAEAKKK